MSKPAKDKQYTDWVQQAKEQPEQFVKEILTLPPDEQKAVLEMQSVQDTEDIKRIEWKQNLQNLEQQLSQGDSNSPEDTKNLEADISRARGLVILHQKDTVADALAGSGNDAASAAIFDLLTQSQMSREEFQSSVLLTAFANSKEGLQQELSSKMKEGLTKQEMKSLSDPQTAFGAVMDLRQGDVSPNAFYDNTSRESVATPDPLGVGTGESKEIASVMRDQLKLQELLVGKFDKKSIKAFQKNKKQIVEIIKGASSAVKEQVAEALKNPKSQLAEIVDHRRNIFSSNKGKGLKNPTGTRKEITAILSSEKPAKAAGRPSCFAGEQEKAAKAASGKENTEPNPAQDSGSHYGMGSL